MENKLIGKREILYLVFGFIACALGAFIESRPAFEDQNFICGILIGASIILLLHGVYFVGKNISVSKRKD